MGNNDLIPEVEIIYATEVSRDPTATMKIKFGDYTLSLDGVKNQLKKGIVAWEYGYCEKYHVKLEEAVAEMTELLIKNWNPRGLIKNVDLNFIKDDSGWKAKTKLPGYDGITITSKNKLDHDTGIKRKIYEVHTNNPAKRRQECVAASSTSVQEAMKFANDFYAKRVQIYNGKKFFSNINNNERRI